MYLACTTLLSLVQDVEEMICLVPELCAMTGLTEAARSDFKVMKVRGGAMVRGGGRQWGGEEVLNID